MDRPLRAALPSSSRENLNYSVCIQFLFMHLACLGVLWTGASAVALEI